MGQQNIFEHAIIGGLLTKLNQMCEKNLTLPNLLAVGEDLEVDLVIDNTLYSVYGDRAPSQNIQSFHNSIDIPSWILGSAPLRINIQDQGQMCAANISVVNDYFGIEQHNLFV